jgi:L-arabinonolactonase
MVNPVPMTSPANLVLDARCQHGEGVVWDDRRQQVLWVDIDGAALWLLDPASGQSRHWPLPDRAGCIGLAEDGSLLLALAKGLYHADLAAALAAEDAPLPLRELAPVEAGNADTRVNDGRCDRHGNFVFGTMNESAGHPATGRWYQYSARHGLRLLPLPGVAIPNSVCFSPDGRTLYYCDTVSGQIMCCDYDPELAGCSNSRLFARVDDLPGASPDGSCMDADGGLWNAQWGGSRVVRYLPDGRIDRIIPVPVPQPSCCALGGPSLERLYVITSPQGMDAQAHAAAPTSGGLYALDVPGFSGIAESRFRFQ